MVIGSSNKSLKEKQEEGLHEYLSNVKGTKVKNYKPTYNKIEVIVINGIAKPIGLFDFKKVKKKYGNYEIGSAMDFHDTKTTSVILVKGK